MSKFITLCGSSSFKRAWYEWHARLELEGHIVLTMALWSPNVRIEPTTKQKERLDTTHLKKIDICDEVFVLDVGGYVGQSTKREISYAKKLGKKVLYLSKAYPAWTEDACTYWRD